MSYSARLIVLWISLLPIIQFGGVFEGAKIKYFWLGGIFLSLYICIRVIKRMRVLCSQRTTLFGVFVVILAIASLCGIHPLESMIGGGYRHQGVLFFYTLLLVSIVLETEGVVLIRNIRTVGVYIVLLENCVLLYQKFFFPLVRSGGTFGEPNAAAGFLIIGLHYIGSSSTVSSGWKFVLSMTTMLALFTTESRIGIGLGLVVLFIYRKEYLHTVGRVLTVLLASLLIAGFFGINIHRYVQKHSFEIINGATSYEKRSLYWQYAVDAISSKPLFGYGAESSEQLFDSIYLQHDVRLEDFMVERAHNIFLDIAMWSGCVGLLAFCLWVWHSVRQRLYKHEKVRVYMILVWFAFACVQPIGVVHWVQFIFLVSGI